MLISDRQKFTMLHALPHNELCLTAPSRSMTSESDSEKRQIICSARQSDAGRGSTLELRQSESTDTRRHNTDGASVAVT